MNTLKLSAAAFLLALSAAGAAPPDGAAGVQASDAWSRASAGSAANGVAYVTLTGGQAADRLTDASTPVADMAMLHQSVTQGGQTRMRDVDAVAIPAGKTVTLSPGGYHIMLMGLHKPLKAGESFPLTLTFDHTAPVTVTVQIRPIGEAAPPMDHNHMH